MTSKTTKSKHLTLYLAPNSPHPKSLQKPFHNQQVNCTWKMFPYSWAMGDPDSSTGRSSHLQHCREEQPDAARWLLVVYCFYIYPVWFPLRKRGYLCEHWVFQPWFHRQKIQWNKSLSLPPSFVNNQLRAGVLQLFPLKYVEVLFTISPPKYFSLNIWLISIPLCCFALLY